MDILHIASKADWHNALENGVYRAASLQTEGFIHCSRPDQVARVANALYAGQADLVLLRIDPDLLQSELRWETVASDEFPHVYGPINLEAVLDVTALIPAEDGRFHYPV